MWIALEFIIQTLSLANVHKKALGLTAATSLVVGAASGAVIMKASAMDDEVRAEQALLWKNHEQKGDIILSNLNTTLTDMKAQLNKIDGRVYDMHENIPREKRKHR